MAGTKYKVGAFQKGKFHHWASETYITFSSAESYRVGCVEICAPQTGMDYKVVEVKE